MSFLQKLLTPSLPASSEKRTSAKPKPHSVSTSVMIEEDAFRSYISSDLYDTISDFIQEWKEEAFSFDTNLRIDENRRVQDSYFLDSLVSLVERTIEPVLAQSKGGGGGTNHESGERSADDDGEDVEDD